MSTKQPSNAFKLTYSKSGDGSFFYSFAEDLPKEKKPAFAVRLGTNSLKTAFRAYLINKEIRKEVFSTTKNAHHMSLLTMNENFKIIVNMNLAQAVIKKFFPSEYLVLDRNHLKKVLWSVYTELNEIRDNIEADFFFEEEMEQFEDALLFRKCLKLVENDEFQVEENSVYPTYASNMPNACTQPSLVSSPLIVPDGALVSTHDIRPDYKYPQKSSKFSIYEEPPKEVDTDSLNITKKQEVETVDGKQAWKSQHGESSVSQAEQSIDTYIDLILKSFIVPDTSGESRNLPGTKYPRTSDKLSSSEATTMEVDTDSSNETKKQEVEKVDGKQAGKSQHGKRSVSQAEQRIDTYIDFILKPFIVPDTSGESRILPGTKYPRTSDKLSSSEATTMEVDTDSSNETKKQEVEKVDGKQAGKSQHGKRSVSQAEQSIDTYIDLILKSFIVPDTSGESRILPGTKYPRTSDKLSSSEATTMEVDTDSSNETKKQEVEKVDGKQAGKSQHGKRSVSQAEQSIDTYIDLILKSFIVPDTSGESRILPGTKYPRTSDKLSSSEATTMEVDTDSSNETKKQEVEKVDGKQAGKSQHGKRSVSQAEQRIDTYIDFILKPFIVPDTSGESRKLPGRKYPRTSDKISICKPTTKEVDTDSLNETKKQEVEMGEDKQAGKSQLGGITVSQSMQNADTHPHLIPNSVRDKSGESRTQPGRKYPLTIDKLSSCKPTTMEVDNDSLNRTKKHEVETVEDEQAGKSQLGGNSVSQIMPNAVTQPHLISKAISLPDTSSESRKLPGRKYPRTGDKISSCKSTTIEVDTDFLNETKKQEVETIEYKQAGKSQLRGSSVSQSMPKADTLLPMILNSISVPDTSGESRKQPGRKYPHTSDNLSNCKPTTMEVDNDSLNETEKHEVETVEGKQAGKSQLGSSAVSQSMPNGDTQPHLIPKPISVPDTSGESRKQPDRKYPKTSDKLSSCKQTTMEVDTDSLNETKKQEVETVEGKQAGKSQLGGNLVSQIMPNAVTQPHLISKAISLPDTSGESRKLLRRKYPRTSNKLSSCKLPKMEVDTDSLNKAKKHEVETVEDKQVGKSQLGGSTVSQSMPNADTRPHLIPISVPDKRGESRKQPGRKYPLTSDKLSNCKPTTMEVDNDSLNDTKKHEVETVEGKQAGKSLLGGSTVSQSMPNADTLLPMILNSISVPDTSGESRKQPCRKYPHTSDNLSNCKPTTMEVDNDSLNETEKHEIETVGGKQAGKSQLGSSAVSQIMPNGDTQPHLIPKPISVPDTSGESRKQPDRKYPKTSDKLSSCKPTTMEVDTDSLNEIKKQEVETVEDKQAAKSQLGASTFSQSMPNADTQPQLIPKPFSVSDTCGESRKHPDRKYPHASDKLSSCKQTTMEVDVDSLSVTTKQDVETFEGKQTCKSQLGGRSVYQNISNADTQLSLILNPILLPNTCAESRKQHGRKYLQTSDKLSSSKPTTKKIDAYSLNETKKQEVETFKYKQGGKSEIGSSSVSQAIANADSLVGLILNSMSLPDTSGESRKQPGRNYPHTCEKLSICKQAMDVDVDSLSVNTKQDVETVEGKQTDKRQLGGSTASQNMPNADTLLALILNSILVRDTSSESGKQPGRKYPHTSDNLSNCKPTTMEVDNDSLNETEKHEVETVEGKQAGKFQLGSSAVSQSMANADSLVAWILNSISLPDTSGESRKQLCRKYPHTCEKLSSCKQAMDVDVDSLNVKTKQDVETVQGKQTDKPQLGGSTTSQNMPNADTLLALILNSILVRDTSGESGKQPGRKYPHTSDNLSNCIPTTMEVDNDSLNETVQGKQAGKSQLGSSAVSQSMPNGDTQPHLIPKPISVPDTSGESRKQPDRKYPKTSDKLSSCKPTTMEVDTDSLNETKKQEVETVEGKEPGKLLLGVSAVAQNMPNTDTQLTSIPKPISVPGTSHESRKQPGKKYPQTSDQLSRSKQTTLEVHAYSTEYDSTSENELFLSESRVLLPPHVYSNRAKSRKELLIPARNYQDIPINLPENGDEFDESPEMSDDEIDSQHLLGFYDSQGHDIELIPLCCHSQPGGYMSYASEFLHIDGFNSSSDDDKKRKKSVS